MAIKYQALMQTIELNAATDTLTVPRATLSDWVFSPSKNLYSCIYELMLEMQTTAPSDITVSFGDYLNDGYQNHVTIDTTDAFSGVISGDVISNILGGLSLFSLYRYRASNTPQNCWFSDFSANDGKWFVRSSADVFRGSAGVDGMQSGVSYTARQTRTLQWPFIAAENAIEDANSATTAQAERCFELIVNGSRGKLLQYSTTGNLNPKGLYYVNDVSVYHGESAALPTTYAEGTPNSDNIIYCSAGPPVIAGNSRQSEDTAYNVTVALTHAAKPAY